MTNEVTKAGVFGGKVALPDAKKLAEDMAQSAATGARPDGDYIGFSGKRGVYEIGKEKRDADKEECWLVNVAGFEDGYICWKGGQVMAKRMYPMGTPLPPLDKNEHGPFIKDGDGWYDAKSMTLRSIDSGQQGYFAINSLSGVAEFADLQREITQRIRAGEAYWPVVKLDREAFTAKGFKNYKPKLVVDGWINDEALAILAEQFEDEDAEIDLEALYEQSGKPPVKAVEAPKKRRAL